ncbi:hypothetical protein RJW59_01505 [Buchnera aphidicola (Formosaphis micheliae)]|uniref:hypothetical protein n=1 Tax=Buchnera aphidicola TaxID=9 RepID=UPI0031B87CD8
MLFVNKVGHTSSLDPLATGMLPVFCGKSIKFAQYSINFDKRYIVIAKLGTSTTTSDSTGEIINIRKVNFTTKKLKETLRLFQ